jgi:hypothetical protein
MTEGPPYYLYLMIGAEVEPPGYSHSDDVLVNTLQPLSESESNEASSEALQSIDQRNHGSSVTQSFAAHTHTDMKSMLCRWRCCES